MNGVRPFALVFLLDVSGPNYREARRELADVLDLVTAKGLLDFLGSSPVVRWVRSHQYGRDTTFTDYGTGPFH